ncbi:MAG TPA: ABC transporter ATP-binding protein, partial [Streptosporangiaceae bacterium]|nr:ABC transporter ATP-binding protein [Streptosporangiaceae bacterium]
MTAPARAAKARGDSARAAAVPDPGSGWLRRISGYCWRYRRNVMLAVGGALLATVVTAVIPLLQRQIIDRVIVTHAEPIWPLAAALLLAAAVGFGAVYLRRYVGGRLALDVQYDLRTELFASVLRLDGARQDEMSTGQLVSRSIADITMVQALLQMVPMAVGNTLLFVFSFAIMLALSPLLTVVAFVIAPALWMIALASRRKLFPASWHASQQAGEIAGIVDESVGGVRVVKGFGQEEQELRRLEAAGAALFASRVRLVRLMARYNPALQAIPSLGLVGVLALGGWLAIHGSITLGTFLAFSSYLTQMSGPVRTLTNLITIGQEARASVVRVFDVIDSRPVITDKPGAVTLPGDAAGFEFDDVHFGYDPSQPVLRGLSLRVQPGETLAVVGMSGSGKSTIAALLPRFYDAASGTVRVGGHDVRDVTRDSLRAAIGLVAEDSFLFSDTVRANIAYGRPGATDEQVVAAAKAAGAHEFITQLPRGYGTVIGEQGLTLSGGQRQRVALARALITDPRVLLLDDATSAVDPRVEAEIHATLRRVMRGRTTLLIAHRRSTLHLASRIAVLDGGKVADIGTHEELTARCPLYRLLISGPGDDREGIAGQFIYDGSGPARNGSGSPHDGSGTAQATGACLTGAAAGGPAGGAAGSRQAPSTGPGGYVGDTSRGTAHVPGPPRADGSTGRTRGRAGPPAGDAGRPGSRGG